jgi:YihY family inner membrane protein
VNKIRDLLRRFDAFQQRHAWAGFPIAVVKKFGDDNGGNYTALIAYFALFSMFPLLLVLSTLLGYALQGHAGLQSKVLHSALAQFPIIGDQLKTSVHSLKGSGLGLAFGIVGSLWGGLGVTQAMENAMNAVWNVPIVRAPNFVGARLRGVGFLSVLGVATLASTTLGSFGGGAHASAPARIGAIAAAAAVNFGVFLAAFKLMNSEPLTARQVLPGALMATAFFEALQLIGGWYVNRQLQGATQVYGFFAVVIGLLVWVSLVATFVLYAAEANVVLERKLWPRSIVQPPLLAQDKRVMESLAKMQQRRPEETIDVSFEERDPA